jgi:hypothetical protein
MLPCALTSMDLHTHGLPAVYGFKRSEYGAPAAVMGAPGIRFGTIGRRQGARSDAPLEGEIEVSADIASNQIAAVQCGLG